MLLLVADDDGLYGRVGHALNLSLHDDHAFVYVSVCVSRRVSCSKEDSVCRWRQRVRSGGRRSDGGH